MTIENILKERGSTHGSFEKNAKISQAFKRVIKFADPELSDSQFEALDNICQKISRIVIGDSDYVDSWVDIAGYAQLIVNQLEEKAKDA